MLADVRAKPRNRSLNYVCAMKSVSARSANVKVRSGVVFNLKILRCSVRR